jgi:hypothetical protein
VGGFLFFLNMSMTPLQQDAEKKYNKILMGNGSDLRGARLFNIFDLLYKPTLTRQDELVLKHFLMTDKQTLEQTTYVANTAIFPSSWGHTVTILRKK